MPPAPAHHVHGPRFDHANEWALLLLALAVLFASMILQADRDTVYLLGHPLPVLCAFRRLTGLRGPGCGLTRSFVFMGHGHPLEAFRMHWLGPLFWTAIIAQVPWRAWRLWRYRRGAHLDGPAASKG